MMDKGEPSSNMCKLVVTNRYFFLETFRCFLCTICHFSYKKWHQTLTENSNGAHFFSKDFNINCKNISSGEWHYSCIYITNVKQLCLLDFRIFRLTFNVIFHNFYWTFYTLQYIISQRRPPTCCAPPPTTTQHPPHTDLMIHHLQHYISCLI